MCRVYEDGQVFGDPYRYAFEFIMVEDGVAEIVGIAVRPPTVDEVRCALRAAKEAGLRVVRDRKAGVRHGLREITRKRV